MPLSKQKLKQLAMELPNGVLSNGLTDAAADLINRVLDKVIGLAFPKGSSVDMTSVSERVGSIRLEAENPIAQARRADPCVGPIHAIPSRTVKIMIRAHAGDIKVPEDTILAICGMLNALALIIMYNAVHEIKDGVAVLDAKHLKSSMSNPQNPNSLLANSIRNVRAKGSRESKSKSKKSKSKKRCSSGKKGVVGFVRKDGVKVKAYCRKSKSRR